MTTQPLTAAPFILKDCQLVIEGDDFIAHVSAVQFNVQSGQVSWTPLTPNRSFSDSTDPVWTCQLTYAQDWTSTKSLSKYLLANNGATKAAKFVPKKGDGLPTFTAQLKIVPGPIGGQVGQVATGQVTLGMDGAPVPDWDGDPATPNP